MAASYPGIEPATFRLQV
uniref:Uncharacterized protein n=1 Tax=Anguilla anguilla TaxID=7936 RepID=A0A0E9XYD7_ANGAN